MTLLDHLPTLRHACPDRLDRDIWPATSAVEATGRLCVGGVPLTDVADEYGTPCYVVDEADFRDRIRRYRSALPGVSVTYAGKSS
jgi:diaminopimelate decarboxylase